MKKLLVIGAGFLQSFVIAKAKNMGYFTLAVDANPNAVGFAYADRHAVIDIVDEKACLDYAKKEKIDGVLTAATDYGVLTASYIAENLNLPGLKYEVAKTIKNKYLIRKCLFENHVDDTEQAFEVNKDTNLEILKEKLTYPVMVKPCDGSGSRGASRVDQKDDLKNACNLAMDASITNRAEIETFIFGKEYGVESLVASDGIHILGVMKKWMTEVPYYAELGHAIPSDLCDDVENHMKDCVRKAIEALHINFGSVNMDLLVTKGGKVHIVDIGARMGGNMIGPCIIPYGTGIDYMANMIRNALGDELDWRSQPHETVATKLIAFTHDGTIKKMPDMKELEKKFNVEIYHHMNIGDSISQYHINLDGCGYIIAKSGDVNDAVHRSEMALENLKNYIF